MRILHLADLHFGTELYGHYDAATGSSTRLADFGHVLDVAVDRAIGDRVDLFLFAGDAYKTRDPSPTQQRELARRLRRLLEAGIPVFLLTGNHDMPNAVARATSLDIFGALSPSGFTVANRPGVHLLSTPSGPLYVVAIPWLTRSALFARDENKNLPPDELHQKMLERLEQALDTYVEDLNEEIPAVLALHGTLQGAIYGAERSVMLSQDLVIPKSAVCRPRFSYVALGHIHKYQVVERAPLTVYAGSPERIDFGEEHDRKGYVMVDLDRQGATHTFVDLPARPFHTVDVRSEAEDPTEDVLTAIAGRAFEGAIVRIRAHLTPANQGRLREVEVRQALRDASYVVVRREVTREWRESDRGRAYSTGMTPLEALHTYLDRERAADTPERRTLLLETGRRLIGELGEEPLPTGAA
ncbi:MAG TPA: exonuclease SbcCD subunit D [Chloroflexota bacterium]|nr:exonuclease SbcCD subunit D [Chloroflexota bacterium]